MAQTLSKVGITILRLVCRWCKHSPECCDITIELLTRLKAEQATRPFYVSSSASRVKREQGLASLALGHIRSVGRNHIYTVYIRKVGRNHTYIYIRCIYVGLAGTIYIRCIYVRLAGTIYIRCIYVGLARTIYLRCIYVGWPEPYIYGVYT